MRIKRQISALLFFLVANILSADITVNYTPSPYLYFERGNAPFSQNDFVAKLGTLVFNNPEGDVIQDPLLLSYNGDLQFTFTGEMDHNRPEESNFRLASTWNNKWRYIDNQTSHLLKNENLQLTDTSVSIGIYLISTQKANRYIEGAIYTWESGTFGSFNLQIQDEDDQNNNVYVPVNGQEIIEGQPPSSTTSLLDPGETIPDDPIPYGDPIEQVNFLLSIVQEETFPIEEAYIGSQIQVAEAQLMLQNALEGFPYAVNITFRNAQNNPDFYLRLNNVEIPYAIPYTLLFGTREVTGGVPLLWEDILAPFSSIPIFIAGIVKMQAEAAVAGIYKDTIFVEITPIDS
ncbi:hypothetical protein [uncultured Sphaerochaeta sp.]|uniref:hypothetical protein n=1 Tax=uncultured Sphaerochaeta sp. TaxID=886478 RepID=UPI0029CA0A47|nr:hypothetical protein [uncultured Sphaerochaeta sp.]